MAAIAFDDPVSRAAIWSRRLALFALPVLIVAGGVARWGRVDTLASLAAVGSGLLLSALAICLALIAFTVIWIGGYRGARRAFTGLLLGAAVLAYPAFIAASNYALPALSDVSTDVASPPVFRVAASERRADENPIDYPGQRIAIMQLAAYPDIGPIVLNLPLIEVQALALDVARNKGWRIVAGEEAAPENAEVQIEAVAKSLLLGLESDIAIRLRPQDRGTRVDMRAASRFGTADFGANAEYIRDYMSNLASVGR